MIIAMNPELLANAKKILHDRRKTRKTKVMPECPFEGPELTGAERERAGVSHARKWLHCLNPSKPLGEVVCRCAGCGPNCAGYPKAAPVERLVIPAEPRQHNRPPSSGVENGRRHLVYHLLPVAGNGTWRRGVDQLRARWPLFTGSKTVAVMTKSADTTLALDPPDVVREYLPPDCHVIELQNDPGLREVVSWIPLWEHALAASGPLDAILYAHSKGASRPVDPGNTCHWWASLAYSITLDHWPLVASQLKQWPITGPFKKIGRGFAGSRSEWHYTGTFYWVKASDFRRRAWRNVDQSWWGTESWPGLAYPVREAGCLFHEGRVKTLNLYDPRYWPLVRTEFDQWLQRNPPAWSFQSIPSAGS